MGLTTRVVRGDKASAEVGRLLLLMHGVGSNENDLAGLAPIIDPDGNFVIVCPRGPYAYGPGFSWFRMENPELVGPTMESSLQALDEVVDNACAEYGLERSQMVAGGFSMGGAMSLVFTFRASAHPRPAGVLCMSGFLPGDPESLDWEAKDEEGLPPVLMQHGIHDPMVPLERAKYTVRVLEEHGVPLQFREYAMDHTVTHDSALDAKDWLDMIRRGETPPSVHTEVAAAEEEDEDALVRSVNSSNFDRVVLQSEKPVIVDFWAPWCGPCRSVAPVIEQIAQMRKGNYVVVKCNIDESPDIAQTYNVQSIPLIGMFRNGRLERTSLGAKPRPQLEAELGMLVIP
jgi:thioredoxin 1